MKRASFSSTLRDGSVRNDHSPVIFGPVAAFSLAGEAVVAAFAYPAPAPGRAADGETSHAEEAALPVPVI